MTGELVGREALERIVRRAAELQAGEREIGEGLTGDEVLALGKDVGIPERYLRQAMLEERTRTTPEPARGTWAWLAGPRTLVAHRVVPGDRATVERALAKGMEEEELLQPKRRFPDHTTWEPKGGAFASIQRALAGKRYALARVHEVSGQVVQLEPGFCLVRLEADIREERAGRLWGAGVMTAVGWAGTAALAVFFPIGDLLIVAPGAVMTAAAVATARAHRGPNQRTLVALEQVLDRLERGEIRGKALPKGSTLGRIADEVLKAFENPGPKPRS